MTQWQKQNIKFDTGTCSQKGFVYIEATHLILENSRCIYFSRDMLMHGPKLTGKELMLEFTACVANLLKLVHATDLNCHSFFHIMLIDSKIGQINVPGGINLSH